MSRTVKWILFFTTITIFILFICDEVEKNAIWPENRLQWLEHLQISPKVLGESKLVFEESIMNEEYQSEIREESNYLQPIPDVKGIYLTSWKASQPHFVSKLIEFISKTEINTLVIDVKDENGRISYLSEVPLAKEIGSGIKKFDPKSLLQELANKNIYPIARIVVFKDPFLAKACPDMAVRDKHGSIWADRKGMNWVDPYNAMVWDYNLAIAKEAAELGFKEIQFDYIRFTSDGNIENCLYPANDRRSKTEVITEFLKKASQVIKPMGVKISADVFGLTCSVEDDLGIGQDFLAIAENVDVICPMVYPSHYYKGQFNLSNPDVKPYETVYRSLVDAKKKLELKQLKTVIRPWLQDFSLFSHYGREELWAQIRAVEDAGLKEWIFWNPRNNYDLQKYLR